MKNYFKKFFFVIILIASTLIAGDILLDEIHFFHVNGYPSLEYSNDKIHEIGEMTGTKLKDWDDIYKGSIALEGKKKLNKNFDLGVLVEYSGGALKDNKINEEMRTKVNFYQDWSVWIAGLNLYYNFNKDGKFNPFIGGGPVYYLSIKSKTKVDVATDFFVEKVRSDYSDNGLGWGAFTGLEYNLGKNWSIDLLINYTWADFKKTITVHDSLIGDYSLEAEANFSGPGIAIGASYKF